MNAISRHFMRDPGGIVVGQDPDDGELLIDKTNKHLRIIGPPGTGKSSSFILPTLSRTWRGSAVVHDRKLELYPLLQGTRKWRHNLLFAPTRPELSVRINPLMEIDTGGDMVTGCQTIALNLPHGGKINVREPIWDQASVGLVAAKVAFLLNFERDSDKNFQGLTRLMAEREVTADKMIRNQHPDPWVRNWIATAARKVYENDNEKYVGSVLATIDAYLEPFNNPVTAEVTGSSEFRLADLVCGDYPVALFLHPPPDHSERLAPLMRILVSQIVNKMMGSLFTVDGRNKHHHLLLALDEYNRFGKVDVIDGAFADMRGYGIRAMVGAQTDGVLLDLYGERSLSIALSRPVYLRPDDTGEAERISKRLPIVRQVRESESDSYGGLGERSGLSVSSSIVERPLMRPDEILSMPVDRVILTGHSAPTPKDGSPPVPSKPILAARPDWSHWLPLCDPKPKAMEPNPIVEFLPVRAGDGRYLDLPPETVPRTPWAGIQHPLAEPVLPAPPEPELPEQEPEPAGPVGLGGKPFDWQYERENVTPGKRTKVYPEPIGPLPPVPMPTNDVDQEGTDMDVLEPIAPWGYRRGAARPTDEPAEPADDEAHAGTDPADEFDLV